MKENEGIFGDDEKVDKIVFRPIGLDMDAKVKKVSDPPPRPLPTAVDNRNRDEWTPAAKKKMESQKIFESMERVGSIMKYVLFTTFALAVLAGLGYTVFWLIEQYNLGG